MRNSTSIFLFITSSLVPTLMADVAMAQSGANHKPQDFLVSVILRTREQTLSRIMGEFRGYAGPDNVLTMEDVELLEKRDKAFGRARLMNGLFQLDLDGDGVVTKAEINLTAESRIRQVKLNYEKGQYSKLIKNQDGSIDIQKAYNSVVKSPEKHRLRYNTRTKQAAKFLALNTSNEEKQIASKTVWKIVVEAFDYFDNDGDGVLRGVELRNLKVNQKKISQQSSR